MIAIIDVNHSFHKSFFVFKKTQPDWDLSKEKYRGILMRKAITDLMASINKLYQKPDDVFFCFDDFSWRKKVSKEYKVDRGDKDPGFYSVINEMHEILLDNGFKAFKSSGAESDDLIAFIASVVPEEVIIISADADMHQLVRPGVVVWNNNTQQPKVFLHELDEKVYLDLDYKKVVVDWEVALFTKILLGCTGDNVSPVLNRKGIGEKTVEKIYRKHLKGWGVDSPENFADVIEKTFKDELGFERVDFREKLLENNKLVQLNPVLLPEEVFHLMIEGIGKLNLLEPKHTYSMESSLTGTMYFS